jgi:endoglucanase
MKLDIALLKRLCETPGIPGREERVRALVEKEVLGRGRALFDEHHVDAMGSLICTRRATRAVRGKGSARARATRVLLAAHMDEIGFYVRHVDDQGCVWLNPAGGFDTRNLFATRVLVATDGGDLPGVMNPGGKPIHISSEADRTKVPGVEEFFVDLGMTAADVKKRVKVGDYVVLDQPFLETPLKVVSKALDNRMAVFVAIEALRRVAARGARHSADIVVAFCTQEEVGLRGATTAANQVGADIGVGLDVTLACDTPGVPDTQRVTRQGDGAAIMVQDSSMISDHRLVDDLCAVARKHRIPHQRAILPRGGQDGAAIQRSGKGARCVALGAGTRYIHTTTEMIDRRDLEAVVDLLAAWLVTVE